MTFDPTTFAGYHQGPTYGFVRDAAYGYPSGTDNPDAYFACHTKPFFVEWIESCLAGVLGTIDTLMPLADALSWDATVGAFVRLGDADPQPDWIALRFYIGYTSTGYSPSVCIPIGDHDHPEGGCPPRVHSWTHDFSMVVTDPNPDDSDPDGIVRPGDFIPDGGSAYPSVIDDTTDTLFVTALIAGYLKRSQTLGTGFTGDPTNDASTILWRPSELTSVTDRLHGHWHEIHTASGYQSSVRVSTFYPGAEEPTDSDHPLMLVV